MAIFGKMMNNFYYGKSGKGDFTKEDMPTTRMGLFRDTLRTRFSALMRLNLMYAVVWLPALLVIAYNLLTAYTGLANLSDLVSQAESGAITAADLAAAQSGFFEGVSAIVMRTLIYLIPCILITGPATAGVAYVTRNWARDEHAFIWSDFKDAVKANWKQALATSAITSVVPIMVYVCWTFYSDMAKNSGAFLIPQVLSLTIGLIWLMSLMYTYPLMVTYKLRYRDVLRNALILSVGRLPMTVGLKLLSLLPAAIAALVSFFTPYMQWAIIILFLYYVVIGFTLSRFVAASYSNAVFDKYINPNVEGAKVNQGLYVEEDDEDEDETKEANSDINDGNGEN